MRDVTILLDRDQPDTRVLSRFWTVFSCRDGAVAPVTRARRAGGRIVYAHPDPVCEDLGAVALRVEPLRRVAPDQAERILADGAAPGARIVSSADLRPAALFERLGAQLMEDAAAFAAPPYARYAGGVGVHVTGEVWAHPESRIGPGVVLEADEGPIIVDAGARLGGYTFVRGPAYIGPGAHIDGARLTGPVVIGRACRIGGEVDTSVVGDFSNKHHEGFLGHSLVGRWVNLGALTTTSDLKNNYGAVRLRAPDARGALCEIATGRIKFGAIVSDCVKTAIGSQLNTGSILDAGANLFGAKPTPPYMKPFSWGPDGVYRLDRFLADCATIFARRGQTPDDAFCARARRLWTQTYGEGA